MKIRTMIVDDEELARRRIRTLLKAEADIEVAAESGDGHKAVEAIASHRPDLLFLDVQMPEVDGFSVLEAIPEADRPAVVFVTAYDRYALRAFEAYALDYLLKPFNRARFQKSLQRARLQIARRRRDEADERVAALLKEVRGESRYLERLVIRSAGRVTFLRSDDVHWFEACANYVRLHAGKEQHLMREKMAVLESRLDPAKFVRIHRSSIVKIDQIKELHSSFDGEHVVVLADGSRLSMSRGYHPHFRQVFKLSSGPS
ncbi:MAG TPA: LytTR family DNA-binding domain-containing protein [Terriglobia bacterium]|nr:LytTR family DNA-binding domain-containing protein [Terriglobia bacterium]